MATTYHIEIKTADQYLAGTDANIFIKLYGSRGISPEERLNGHISGNAFERNHVDKCDLSFNDDCGDIYMISVRSDQLWAGADWMCDYFTVQRENGPIVKFQLPSGQWIEDESVHQYHATAGYPYDLPEHAASWTKIYGATHYIPPNMEMECSIKSILSIDVNVSEVQVIKTSTKTALSVEVDAIKSAFEFQIESSLNKQVENKLHQSMEVCSSVRISAQDSERTFQEVWSQCDYVFEAHLGDDTYNFRVPMQKVFAGFFEVDSLWGDQMQ